MRDTQQNIKTYKQQLRHVREKIATAGLLFLVSITMLTTASFAWLVLSRSPEVSNISTTVAGNGSLEIALASSDVNTHELVEPAASKVGDGSSEISLLERNKTWGNLVNLGTTEYGLEEISLRPATLNEYDLLKAPLIAVKYGEDGRINEMSSDFIYSNYDSTKEAFLINNYADYGVRAISSVTFADLGSDKILTEVRSIESSIFTVANTYALLIQNQTYLNTISGLMGCYLNARANDDADCSTYMDGMVEMLGQLDNIMESVLNIYLNTANLQIYKQGNPYDYYTKTTLLAETEAGFTNKGITIMDGFLTPTQDDFKSDYIDFKTVKTELEKRQNDAYVSWWDIAPYVNKIVNIETCQIGEGDDAIIVGKITKEEALSLAGSFLGKALEGIVREGILENMSERLGKNIDVDGLKISVLGIPVTINVRTEVEQPFEVLELPVQLKVDTSTPKEMVAGDVYGMVIDLWVRTNADDSYLTLEGKVETRKDPIMFNEFYTYENADGIVFYHKPAAGVTVPKDPGSSKDHLNSGQFFYLSTGDERTFATDDNGKERSEFVQELKARYETVITGYDGVNRVWQEGAFEDEDSTTQGKGSCFIFYPESPIEKDQTIELLKALRIAFISNEGKGEVLATAHLDTDSVYDDLGKVIVPIELDSDSEVVKNYNQEDVAVITPLNKGESKFITTIVYLDGTLITNDLVDEEDSIDGFLNIQFGSSEKLVNNKEDELYYESVEISANVTPLEHEYDADNLPSSTVTATIVGVTPKKVEAQFVKQLNGTQGIQQQKFELSPSSGSWTGDYTFELPGDYILRSLWIDGVEYDLETQTEVKVGGFNVDFVTCTATDPEGYKAILTDESTYNTQVTVSFGTSAYVPNTVQGIFRGEGNEVVRFNLDNTGSQWTGNVKFTKSGTYVLDTLLIDGQEYYQIEAAKQKTLILNLGVSAKLKLSGHSFMLPDNLNEEIGIEVIIFDNAGNELMGLQDIELFYKQRGDGNLYEKLEWDSTESVYKGNFNVTTAGIYSFHKLIIGTSEIDTIKGAPTITIGSHIVPTFGESKTASYQFAPKNDAAFALTINDAPATQAYIVANHNNKKWLIPGTINNNVWSFVLPMTTEPNHTRQYEGDWSLEQLWLSGGIEYKGTQYNYPFIDEDSGEWVLLSVSEYNLASLTKDQQTLYDNSWIWTIEEVDDETGKIMTVSELNITTEIANEVYVTFNNPNNLTMEYYDNIFSDTISGKVNEGAENFSFELVDHNGDPFDEDYLEVTNIALTYDYLENSAGVVVKDSDTTINHNWWSNSSSWLSEFKNTNTTVNYQSTDNSTYEAIQNNGSYENLIFSYPGTYTPVVEITAYINGKQEAETVKISIIGDNGVAYTNSKFTQAKVTWKRPSIYFSGTTPVAGTTFKNESNKDTKNVIISKNNDVLDMSQIKVYFKRTRAQSYIFYNLTAPSALATIKDVGNNMTATCIIVDSNNSANLNVTYTFTQDNQEVSKGIGKAESVSIGNDKKYAMGANSKAEFITVNYSGKDYIFTLEYPLTVVENS